MGPKVLEVQSLVKVFKNEDVTQKVLNHISFDVEEGEFVSIMGPSGSGKSTLLYHVSGMDFMTEGEVMLCGENLSGQSASDLAEFRLHKMGFVFQHNYLLKNLNLLDNICLPGFKAKKKKAKEVINRGMELMEKLGIAKLCHRGIHEVSGGQLQRAAVCRALINEPKILFADEPTGALNSGASEEVMNILSQLNKEGMTILLVTHDPTVASATHRIIYLKDGVLTAEFYPEESKIQGNQKEGRERVLNWLLAQGF